MSDAARIATLFGGSAFASLALLDAYSKALMPGVTAQTLARYFSPVFKSLLSYTLRLPKDEDVFHVLAVRIATRPHVSPLAGRLSSQTFARIP